MALYLATHSAYSLLEGLALPSELVPAAAGYGPRTKWSNPPYRFSAGGDGNKFTSAEFSAWMESKCIHVSKGAPQPMPAAATNDPQQSPAR